MFSEGLRKYASDRYTAASFSAGKMKEIIRHGLLNLDEDQRTLAELAYGTAPIEDVGAVSFDVIMGYVNHAIFLRKHYPHVQMLTEEMFLHYVFYPRVGTEALVDCRGFFHEKTKEILSLPEKDWILAVNRWCAAQMTYRSADDRTENPLTAYLSGEGRCGEESVFVVSVLRSLGIPARQVYAPWWSHCDDNHAWVEVWEQGKWHFLGACEIEPIINRGWFISAATRAPLVHSKTYFPLHEEELIGQDGPCWYYNQTNRYAETGRLCVTVKDEENNPLPGAELSFGVINMAAERTIARMKADRTGTAQLTVGCGTILITARHNGKIGTLTMQPQPGVCIQGEILCRKTEQDEEVCLDVLAPSPTGKNACPLTKAQQQEKQEAIAQADRERAASREARTIPPICVPEELRELVALAVANGENIAKFYAQTPEALKPMALEYLKSLSKKDMKDIPAKVLGEHFYTAIMLPVSFDQQFVPYVMCPRIGFEELEFWRSTILDSFTPKQAKAFMENPKTLMTHLRENYLHHPDRYHRELTMTPETLLALGHGNLRACRVLFVAVMRTLGIPSRLSPQDGCAQYYRDGQFHSAEEDNVPMATLTLQPEPGIHWINQVNYTLCRRDEEGDTILMLEEDDLRSPLSLLPGQYRLTTSNRLPNGNQRVLLQDFTLSPGQKKTVSLRLKTARAEEMLAKNTLPPCPLEDEQGKTSNPAGKHILAWLDIGTEPTEHILNELLCHAEKLNTMALPILLILQRREDLHHSTLQQVLRRLPRSKAAFGDFDDTPEQVARAMYLEPGQWPLLVLTDGTGSGCYGHCGYGVGIVELTMKLAEVEEK